MIISVYNGQDTISQMLDSVCSQTYKNLEIICINDGSTDDTVVVLKKYKKVATYTIENSGAANARLFGLSKASGDYVIFVDADDFMELTMLEKMMKMARVTLADMVVCGFSRIRHGETTPFSTELVSPRHDITKKNIEQLTYVNTALWNKLIKRDIIPQNITLPRVTQGDDMCFLLYVYPHIKRVTFIPEPLFTYIVYDNSLMSDRGTDNFNLLLDTLATIKNEYDKENYSCLCGICFVAVTAYLNRFYASGMDKGKLNALCKRSRKWFNETFPDWKKTPCFRRKTAKTYGFKAVGLWGSSLFFRMGGFPIYMPIFKGLKKSLKISW